MLTLSDLHILCVDDNSVNLKLLEAILSDKIDTVYTATNGKEGVEVFDSHRDSIHAVLTDMFMPIKGGQYLIDHVQSVKPETLVIAISDYSAVITSECNADITLQKPIKPEDVTLALEAYCEHHEEE